MSPTAPADAGLLDPVSEALAPPMTAGALVSSRLPAASPTDVVEDVLGWMDELRSPQLAVVNQHELLGLVDAHELRRADRLDDLLEEVGWAPAHGSFVLQTQHAYDVVALMAHSQRALVPVLSPEQQYVGSIGRDEVMRYVAAMLAVTEPGGVILLEMERTNYHLREISSIVESNGARVLSLYVSNVPESARIHVTLKLSQSELTPLLLGFERYGYTVAYAFFDAQQLDDPRERFEALIRYLSI